jgi:hypothetical protein
LGVVANTSPRSTFDIKLKNSDDSSIHGDYRTWPGSSRGDRGGETCRRDEPLSRAEGASGHVDGEGWILCSIDVRGSLIHGEGVRSDQSRLVDVRG